MKNKRKILIVILLLFLHLFFSSIGISHAIYRQTLSTQISLTVLEPSTTIEVTLHLNDGTNNTMTEYRTYNQTLGNVTPPTRTDYNFLGWYDSNGNRFQSGDAITTAIDLYAHWQKIVCKKVTNPGNLHTETCAGTQGCLTSGTGFNKTTNSTITYGTTYSQSSPIAGDAYDCDVNNDGNYDPQDQYGKHTERFYFLKENENNNSENTGSLIYYTSFDENGRIDTQHTPKDDIGSYVYETALTYLPTSSTWTNPSLVDFNSNNGKISRFMTIAELEAVCGTIPRPFPTPPTTVIGAQYFNTCQKWFLFENSRFQSSSWGRAGIWLQIEDGQRYRIQTSVVSLMSVANDSENTARPVIEIPMSAFEGYVNAERYTINFETHGGTSISSIRRYSGEMLGTIDTPTREHYNFDGWYADYFNEVYSTPVTSATVVTGNMTLHAKWIAKPTNTVTFNANGGTINGESTYELIVDTGDTIDLDDIPAATYQDHAFDGWYTDSTLNELFDETEPITSNIILYAAWGHATYVASVNGVGYETLADAIDAVPEGTQVATRVTLLRNVTLDDTLTIPSTKWVELVGGNRTISGSDSLIINEGKLNIVSGTITIDNGAENSVLIANASNATLNISGGTLINNNTTVRNVLITNARDAILNITGGTLTNNSYVSGATTEFLVIENKNGTVSISGGTLSSYGQSAGINNNGGTLNVSGGEIIAHNTTKGQAIYLDGGTVNISGNAYIENVSGATGFERAAVDNNGGTLRITGGTIVSKGYSAVKVRKNGTTTQIGTNDEIIDISSPVLRGKAYGLEKDSAATTNVNIKVYDGIFESLDQSQAINPAIVTDKPDGINFKTDGTISVEGVSYHAAYLLAPSITVYFYEESGGTAIPVVVDNGTAIDSDLPTPTPRQGYYFLGWYIDGDLMQPVTSATIVTGPFNAYAKWVQSVSNATMSTTMNLQIGESDTIEFQENDIEDVTYSSSNTSVATVDSDGTVHAVGAGTATITITGDVSNATRTVTVTVTRVTYTVTFKDGNNVIKVVTVEGGETVDSEMPPNQTKTNYIFNGWVYEDNNTLTPFTSATQVYGNIDAFVSWKETIAIATIPTSPMSITVGSSRQILVTATGSGGIVEDYTLSSSNTNYVTVNVKTINGVDVGSITLTITGVESHVTRTITVNVVNSYSVTFDPDNGEEETVIQVEIDSTIDSSGATLPNDPTKTDYVFDRWYLYDEANSTLTSTPLDTSAIVTSDTIYKAKWVSNTYVAAV